MPGVPVGSGGLGRGKRSFAAEERHMPEAVMSEGRNLSVVPTDDDGLPEFGRPGFADLASAGHLGDRVEIEKELDGIAIAMRTFHLKPPDLVMREVAAYTARLTEMCVLLVRVESLDRQYTKVRTQQVERFLAELERQYRIASRLVEVSRQDLSMLGGMT